MEEIIVSIYCATYNHADYIKDALEGFISQRTNFKYEIVVHDDASTDGTTEIIKEYERKYPDKIKAIYQYDNQYSKGISIDSIVFPHLKGKYVAICEGDDYWCDYYKLQRQVDFLNQHKEYSACVSNTKQINCITGEESLINLSEYDMDLEFNKVVERGNSQFQLSSLICRKEYFILPKEIIAKGFGDYPLAIYLMMKGKIRYLKDVMSIYRLYANGSWTYNHYVKRQSINELFDTQKNLLDFLYNLQKYCVKNGYVEFLSDITKVLRIQEARLLLIQNKGKKIYEEYYDVYCNYSFKDKLKTRCSFLTAVYYWMRYR